MSDSINILHSANEYYNKFYESMQLVIDERYRFITVSWIESMQTWNVIYSNFIIDEAE